MIKVSTELSFFSLFINASFVVKLVMLALFAASIFSWALIYQRSQVIRRCLDGMEDFEFTFWSGIDLGQLYNKLSVQHNKVSGLETIFIAGFKEFMRIRKQNPDAPLVVMEGVQRSMRIAISKELEKLEENLPFLATIQSTSPFVGLFGTVWGIMHVFKQLGAVQQASIAMVGPGISEALIATAMGLIAAIPAGIAYNRYASRLDYITNRYNLFFDEFVSIMHRRVHTNTAIREN